MGGMATDVAAVAAGGLIPSPDRPVPWPPPDWRCLRWKGISGRYSGSADLATILRIERLELRLDIDTRNSADSPVMNKVSGDHFVQNFRPFPPGFGPELYSHSWIVDNPVVAWARCSATITGDVRYFSGGRPRPRSRSRSPGRGGHRPPPLSPSAVASLAPIPE